MMLLKLPFDVNLCVLKDWVLIVELGRLDSAICNEKERQSFLELISSDLFVVHSNRSSCLDWIVLRSIKLSSCIFFNTFPSSLQILVTTNLLAVDFIYSVETTIGSPSLVDIASFIKSCPLIE